MVENLWYILVPGGLVLFLFFPLFVCFLFFCCYSLGSFLRYELAFSLNFNTKCYMASSPVF